MILYWIVNFGFVFLFWYLVYINIKDTQNHYQQQIELKK